MLGDKLDGFTSSVFDGGTAAVVGEFGDVLSQPAAAITPKAARPIPMNEHAL
jgi:hypothetical protein